MNNKQRKTLAAIFSNPTPKTMVWADIEALLLAIGCEIIEGDGSRVRFIRDNVIGYFHRPHQKKEAAPYQIRDAKTFLTKLGVEP
ncbi:MAG: type II toxin-antitoxin system HicA family toxin [Treponema sp.]|nr:type II toxin-antitoxin system HicA family toxin [Treponema sp.]